MLSCWSVAFLSAIKLIIFILYCIKCLGVKASCQDLIVCGLGKNNPFQKVHQHCLNPACFVPFFLYGIRVRMKGGIPQEKTIGSMLYAFNFPSLSLSPSEENTYDEYENELGITAIALYDYQAGK